MATVGVKGLNRWVMNLGLNTVSDGAFERNWSRKWVPDNRCRWKPCTVKTELVVSWDSRIMLDESQLQMMSNVKLSWHLFLVVKCGTCFRNHSDVLLCGLILMWGTSNVKLKVRLITIAIVQSLIISVAVLCTIHDLCLVTGEPKAYDTSESFLLKVTFESHFWKKSFKCVIHTRASFYLWNYFTYKINFHK